MRFFTYTRFFSIRHPHIGYPGVEVSMMAKYMRRVPSLEALIPSLYLKGISTGNMQEALINPIESTFATVRHRSEQTKGCGSRQATLSMVYKLGNSAQKHWRNLRGHQLIAKIVQGVKFKDGEEVEEAA